MTPRFGRGRRAEAAALDALLDATAPGDDALGRLLDAARAPSTGPDAGLDAALVAFRRADPPQRERRAGIIWRRVLATTLTTKLVAGASVAVAAAGITVAGTRSDPAPPRPSPTMSSTVSDPVSTAPSRSPSDSDAPSSDEPSTPASDEPTSGRSSSGTGSADPSGPGNGTTGVPSGSATATTPARPGPTRSVPRTTTMPSPTASTPR